MVLPVVPPPAKPVHRKVAFASAGTYVGTLILTTLVQALQDGSLLAFLPPTASAVVAPVVPAVLTFLVGYLTSGKVGPEDAKALALAAEEQIAAVVETKVAAAIDARFPQGEAV